MWTAGQQRGGVMWTAGQKRGGVMWTAGQQSGRGHVDSWTTEWEGSCRQLDNRGGGVKWTHPHAHTRTHTHTHTRTQMHINVYVLCTHITCMHVHITCICTDVMETTSLYMASNHRAMGSNSQTIKLFN